MYRERERGRADEGPVIMKRYLILLMLLCQPVGTAWALDCNDWIGDNAEAFWTQAAEADVERCIGEGANPLAVDGNGKSPLDYALKYKRSRASVLLAESRDEFRRNQTQTMLKDLADIKRMVETLVDQRAQHDANVAFPELEPMREELANVKGLVEELSDSILQQPEGPEIPDFSKMQKELEDIKRLFETVAKPGASPGTERSIDLPWLVTLLALIMVLVMIGVVGWLFRRRTDASATRASISEGEFGSSSSAIEERLASIAQMLEELSQREPDRGGDIQPGFEGIKEEVQSIKNMLMNFQSTLDDKDEEIKRLKEGYDASILKSHLERIARVHTSVIQRVAKDPDNKFLRNIGVMIEDSLGESGVTLEYR